MSSPSNDIVIPVNYFSPLLALCLIILLIALVVICRQCTSNELVMRYKNLQEESGNVSTHSQQPNTCRTSLMTRLTKRREPYETLQEDRQHQAHEEATHDDYCGKIHFKLGYDKTTDALIVTIVECVDLRAGDLNGLSDPYVRVSVLPYTSPNNTKRTRVCHRTLNPRWRETLYFLDHSFKHHDDMSIVMQVMDHDRFSHDEPLGEVMMPLRNVKLESGSAYWKNLQRVHVDKKPTTKASPKALERPVLVVNPQPKNTKESCGEIMLSLCYTPNTNKITVVVIKCKDLAHKDLCGTSDPYVKLWLFQGQTKLEKRKTTIKTQSLAPVYNECFQFTVPAKEKLESEVNLLITVMDHDLITSNDEIGHVVVGAQSTGTGLQHWREMLSNADNPTAAWHKLSPKW